MRRSFKHPREAITLLAFAAFTALIMTGSLAAQASRAVAQEAGYTPQFIGDGKLRLPPMGGEIVGRFRGTTRGFGFVVPDDPCREGDLYVPASAVRDALSGDRVRAEVIRLSGGARWKARGFRTSRRTCRAM